MSEKFCLYEVTFLSKSDNLVWSTSSYISNISEEPALTALLNLTISKGSDLLFILLYKALISPVAVLFQTVNNAILSATIFSNKLPSGIVSYIVLYDTYFNGWKTNGATFNVFEGDLHHSSSLSSIWKASSNSWVHPSSIIFNFLNIVGLI